MNILPFRGYRYNPEKINNHDEVICPPYDQFKPGMGDLLFAMHPNNMARLIMDKITEKDNAKNNRYIRSGALLKQWFETDVFVREEFPAIYPYYQDYRVSGQAEKTRKGFIALGEVTDYSARVVLPHEKTLSKPKEDRLNLLRATLADTGLVFMLYSDPAGEIEKILDETASQPPLVSAHDLNRERNRLWKIEEQALIKKVADSMRDQSVIIADGHHRYEVARLFRDDISPRIAEDPAWNLYNYKLMSFIRLESEGITIFPIHRLVHKLRDFDAFGLLQRLGKYFQVETIPSDGADPLIMAEKVVALMGQRQLEKLNCFGLYLPADRSFHLLIFLPQHGGQIDWPADKSIAWRQLDISVLQVVILDHLLGIGEKELAAQTNLEYVSCYRETIQTANAKSFQCAFLLNPTPIHHVKQVVEAGDLLPQKSTHFHPKLMEGLVFARHIQGRSA